MKSGQRETTTRRVGADVLIRNHGWTVLSNPFICSRSSSASDGGRISGTVVDPSGAVVRTAIVVTLNSDTGAQQSRTTDDYGVYTFPLLPTGHYQIEITAPGFATYRQTGLDLTAAAALSLNVELKLKSEATTVEVSAETLQIFR